MVILKKTDGPCMGRIFAHLAPTDFLNWKMQKLDFSRKMDTTGRLVIPIRLREELNLQIGKEYQFFKHEENGKIYLCIECSDYLSDIEKAKQLLKLEGYEISK